MVSRLLGHLDGKARQVGEELHEERVPGRAPVGAKRLELEGKRIHDIPRLEGRCFEGGPDEVLAPRAAGDPADEPARLRDPVR